MLRKTAEDRRRLWTQTARLVEDYLEGVDSLPVSPKYSPQEIQDFVEGFDFRTPHDSLSIIETVAEQLKERQVHSTSANYYGLFNPESTTMGIAADFLVAAFNPQLAAWNASPFAIELEQHLIRTFGELFGYEKQTTDGTFTSGGAEANLTAVLCALTDRFPGVLRNGLRTLEKTPTIYASRESHDSLLKAARIVGLGDDAFKMMTVGEDLRLEPSRVEQAIKDDIASGYAPFMIVATAGTTNAGIIDPIQELGALARKYKLWFHVDAAWGGAAAFAPSLHKYLSGMDQSDSITFDCHKWLSVPMGAGVLITRHPAILTETFAIDADYMPADGKKLNRVDPYLHSVQWSRRFIGLKVFASLAERSIDGYSEIIEHQVSMGQLLRKSLTDNGWNVLNPTPLPIACFTDANGPEEQREHLSAILEHVLASGNAWLSTTTLGTGATVLRACITNFRTDESNIKKLIESLDRARNEISHSLSSQGKRA